jgi:hypothetical protein
MRISLGLVLLLSSEVWAIGLGDINLDSALNEPLRAEIELLSAKNFRTWLFRSHRPIHSIATGSIGRFTCRKSSSTS